MRGLFIYKGQFWVAMDGTDLLVEIVWFAAGDPVAIKTIQQIFY